MNIVINFSIEYKTYWGQYIGIIYSTSPIFDNEISRVTCSTKDGKNWIGDIMLTCDQKIYYKYQLLSNEPTHEEESLIPRSINTTEYKSGVNNIYILDKWRSKYDNRKIFFSAAFKEAIFRRDADHIVAKIENQSLVINLYAADIPQNSSVAVMGNTSEMGSWLTPQKMNYDNGKWTIIISQKTPQLEYKYVLINKESLEIIKWEVGENRTINKGEINNPIFINDEGFRLGGNWWRGSGLAIPVFSIRSKNGMGIGEFSDLKLMIDLAREMNMNFLQTLPVNDTIANKTWTDSYPYAAISVYALHPLYIHIPDMADITKYPWHKEYKETLGRLNQLSVIDFEEVLKKKTEYTMAIYEDVGKSMMSKKEIKDFVTENQWVKSYAVFCHLRDVYQTPNFNNWNKEAHYKHDILERYWKGNIPDKEVGYYVYLQYYLDKQLREAHTYGREQGVVLKGDLPIGIYRYSCDAWINPHLYNMDQQAGAPPDDYAVNGQNWGFPTYNWEEMSKDQFSWWRSRMTQLANYFDALRIDHILGFFRIWSIPMKAASGTLGMFNPRLPYHRDELTRRGLTGDLLRYTQPYIRLEGLQKIFGEKVGLVIDEILEEVWTGAYTFQKKYENQINFLLGIENEELTQVADIKDKILALYTEVILIEEPNSDFIYFNPRITVHSTQSYQELDEHNKRVINDLYNEYYFTRHNEYWKNQAEWKLPAILEATDMFICGEDLGMIPSTVPQVMKKLNIIPLEIQRMPKGHERFGVCKQYDYQTVCSPSCHDMSTIRGWWEASHDVAKSYYRDYMGRYDDPPRLCSTEIVEYVIQDHLHSPSMLAIFPIQDILGLDYDLRMGNPEAEQINVPANPKHYWRYRLHLNIEDILANKYFCNKISNLVKGSGRGN